jgi:tRNA-dihydrouridine synthase
VALTLGRFTVDPPVVLAPMAGITNSAYRRLCRAYGAGLYVSEMVTSRALLERDAQTLRMVHFHESEHAPRSVQLYGVDPDIVAAAVRMVVREDLSLIHI